MQYALYDLRRWGFKKIFSYYEDIFGGRCFLLSEIMSLNNELYEKKNSAYTCIRMWDIISDHIKKEYKGMRLLMLNIEPLITSISVDKACQRRFNNSWIALWREFSKDINIDNSTKVVLSDLGIRLCYADNVNIISAYKLEIVQMYNVLLYWYIFTLSELNMSSFNVKPISMIENLVTMDSKKFIDYIIELIGETVC